MQIPQADILEHARRLRKEFLEPNALRSKGWKGIACFLVDGRKEGFRRGDIYDIMGGRAIGAGEFHLDNYFVGEDDMVAPPGEAFKHAMGLINGARAYVAAMCCGIMTSCLDTLLLTAAFGRLLAGLLSTIRASGGRWSMWQRTSRLCGR